jgi:uridine kinase
MGYFDFSVDADVRLAQRIHRDTVEKGRSITAVLEQVN